MQSLQQESDSIWVGIARFHPAVSTPDGLDLSLSAADQERAARFRFPEDRARFVLGRRLLVTLIGEVRGTVAQPLELALTEHSRPYLADDPALTFNISHAGDVVAVALTLSARIGIDVESLDRTVKLAPLAERIFHAADLARFRALPPDTQHRAFFRAWTGKEAILKAEGVGLFGGVQEISVPLEGDQPLIVPTADRVAWQLTPLALPDDYVGAVACDDPGKVIAMRNFTF